MHSRNWNVLSQGGGLVDVASSLGRGTTDTKAIDVGTVHLDSWEWSQTELLHVRSGNQIEYFADAKDYC